MRPEHMVEQAQRPNIVLVLFDDMGFSDLGCYGSSIRTPNVDALAERGRRFSRFDVTPLCSPTRASLLTGRNPHAVGMGTIVQFASDHPGYSGAIPRSAAMLPRLLRDAGYSSGLFGKWHLSPPPASGPGGPYDQWPIARGFDRFFGFLPGRVHQFRPELVNDNTFVESPRPGTHVSELIVDEASRWIIDHVQARPGDPFFAMLSFGAVHSPHHAPEEFVRAYDGAFSHGWDEERERRFERQRELGVVPPAAKLPQPDPRIPAWSSLEPDERRLAERLMGAYAGHLEHADAEFGRLIETLRRLDVEDHTIFVVLSDNGATNAGGSLGTLDEEAVLNDAPASHPRPPVDLDRIGGPDYLNQYPAGWGQASNTPYRRYKHTVHNGGTRSPLIVAGPGVGAGSVDDTEIFVTDLLPTLLDVAGVPIPEAVDGVPQMPLHGRSFSPRLGDAPPMGRRAPQYLEVAGHRAIVADGWKAVTFHKAVDEFESDRWELYHLDEDPTESDDVAQQNPAMLEKLVEFWWSEARRFDVLPLQIRGKDRLFRERPDRTHWVLTPGMTPIPHVAGPELSGHDFDIAVELDPLGPADEGVLVAAGDVLGGFSLYIADGRLAFGFNALGAVTTVSLPPGEQLGSGRVEVAFRVRADGGARIALSCPGRSSASGDVPWSPRLRMYLGTVQCGHDPAPAAVPDYTGPFPFTGRMERAVISIPVTSARGGEPDVEDSYEALLGD
jgi:arylsulfatase